jgi:hypothetical protein
MDDEEVAIQALAEVCQREPHIRLEGTIPR